MQGDFTVRDNTFSRSSNVSKRKCHVHMVTRTNEAVLEFRDEKSTNGRETECKTFYPGSCMMFLGETKNQKTISLAFAMVSSFDNCLILEGKHNSKTVLKEMDSKLREILRVISYDITIKEMSETYNEYQGVVHVFSDKVIVTQGFPPDLNHVFTQSLCPGENNEIMCVGKQGLSFAAKPDILVLSEHRDDIWKILQGCINENALAAVETSSQRLYQNLPQRPCRYIYMNLADKRNAPFNHNYVNVFNMSGAIYQNWQNCQSSENSQQPPPCPPRRPPPPLPPKPRNRPPNSPLPPIPVIPQSSNCCPSLPPRQSPPRDGIHAEDLQFVIYSSKPLVGQFFVIQVVFLQKNDYDTLQRIKKLEEESNYQLLKPLPEHMKVTGDFQISLLEIESGCDLKSDQVQTVEFNVVKDAVLPSCWMVIEFHLKHKESMSRIFHGKIVIEPKNSKSVFMTKKDVLVSANFQNQVEYPPCSPTLACNSLTAIGVKKYLGLCRLLDPPCALGNNWTGLAGEIGLLVNEVFIIQSKAVFPNFSPTNEVLSIWSQRENGTCCLDNLRTILLKLQRFDVVSMLDDKDN